MEEMLTPAMKETIAALGELIKADPRHTAIQTAIAEYERSEELNGMIAEYNTQQNLLSDLYGKTHGEASDEAGEDMRDTIQNRIDELYDQITNHPVYTAYVSAKEAFDALTNEVYGELQFVITGQRPCSHDCSSCGSGCSGCH
ncbi:MAG: YlbF family regulator [Clostridia bacterium]|nr:YlbF family regulator [Clostridia bacterium]